MASNRLRSLRNVGTRLNANSTSIGTMSRRPSPRKLAANLVSTGNIRRYAATEPVIAPKAVTSEKLEDGAVGSDALANDAVTAKTIRESELIDCTFERLEGVEFTLSGPSFISGNDVVISQCTLEQCIADAIIGESGLNLSATGDIGIAGGGVILSGGGSLVTVAGDAIGLGPASGGTFQMAGGNANFSVGVFNVSSGSVSFTADWNSFLVGGAKLTRYSEFTSEINRLEGLINNLQSQLNNKSNVGHSH